MFFQNSGLHCKPVGAVLDCTAETHRFVECHASAVRCLTDSVEDERLCADDREHHIAAQSDAHDIPVHHSLRELDGPHLTVPEPVLEKVTLDVLETKVLELAAVAIVQICTEIDICWSVRTSVKVDCSASNENGFSAHREVCGLGEPYSSLHLV